MYVPIFYFIGFSMVAKVENDRPLLNIFLIFVNYKNLKN